MTNDDRKTKHGEVLIAIKNDTLHEHISLQNEHSDCITIKIKTKKDSVVLLCCIYNAPYQSNYQWEIKDLKTLIENIQLKAKECQCNLIILTGELNLSQTNWLTMSSILDYEKQITDALVERNFSNQSTDQLGVVSANNRNSMVNCEYDNSLQNDLMQNDKNFSDHEPIVTTIDLEKEETQFAVTDIKYVFNKADCDELNKSILQEPFQPYCYKNVDELLKQWYRWLWKKIDKHISGITKQRSQLPPGFPMFHQIL